MLWAAFTTCFFGFMRSVELCIQDTSKGFDATTDLSFQDVASSRQLCKSFFPLHSFEDIKDRSILQRYRYFIGQDKR